VRSQSASRMGNRLLPCVIEWIALSNSQKSVKAAVWIGARGAVEVGLVDSASLFICRDISMLLIDIYLILAKTINSLKISSFFS
jgi:hypothetical protein